jgi:ABC-type transport system substrate-binding protein
VVRISEDPSLEGRVQNQSILSIFWLTPNMTQPPLDNLQVRQALTMAIDRQAIIDSVLQGQGVAAHGPLPPGLSAYDPSYDPYPYDPDGARALLAEAGYPDGVDVEFRTWTDEVEGRVLTAIQAQWAEVGIRATFNRTEYTAYISDLTNCNLMLGTQSWTADYADPDNFVIPLISDSGTAVNCGLAAVTEPKDLALEALTLPLGAERDELYREAERAVVENVLGIFLYHRGATMVTGPNVQGAYLDPYNNVILDPISLTG